MENLARLANQIAGLHQLPPIDRALRARRLADDARAALAAAKDAAIYEATRTADWATVADELGVSVPAVNKAITRHKARSK